MRRKSQQEIPPVLDRYEAKYTIPECMVDPISEFASVYCALDRYSDMTEDKFYGVNSLYFDTPNYLFLHNRIDGSENRFNMRIRSYGDTPQMPYFFEIKQKKSNIIRKYRARVDNTMWRRMFENMDFATEGDNADADNWNLFLRLAHSHIATPKVLTQYRRKAYISEVDDYARVTFDKSLRYQPEDGYNLVPDENRMVSTDNETLFDPGCSVVLELKCYCTQVPLWMIDLIGYFDLKKRSFSKYMIGVTEVLNLFRHDGGSTRMPTMAP